MSKYTPGPWIVKMEDRPTIFTNDGYYIARAVHFAGTHSDDNTATCNAELIAASPELYEALQRLHDSCARMRFDGIKETDAEANARKLLERLEGLV